MCSADNDCDQQRRPQNPLIKNMSNHVSSQASQLRGCELRISNAVASNSNDLQISTIARVGPKATHTGNYTNPIGKNPYIYGQITNDRPFRSSLSDIFLPFAPLILRHEMRRKVTITSERVEGTVISVPLTCVFSVHGFFSPSVLSFGFGSGSLLS